MNDFWFRPALLSRATVLAIGVLVCLPLQNGCSRPEPTTKSKAATPELRVKIEEFKLSAGGLCDFDSHMGAAGLREFLQRDHIKIAEPARITIKRYPYDMTDEVLGVLIEAKVLHRVIVDSPPYDLYKRSCTGFTQDGHEPGRFEEITRLDLSKTAVTGQGLKHLAVLPKLTWLNLNGTPVGDDGLEHLARLTNLKSLSLSETRVTGIGLKHLAGLKNLTHLDLSKTPVTDDGLATAELETLTNLNLTGTMVTGAGVKHALGSKGLVHLRLDPKQLTDDALEVLAAAGLLHTLNQAQTARGMHGAAGVADLDLRESPVTDAGLAHLTPLVNLTSLDLSGTAVTDAGLEQLAGRTKLAKISLNNTRVTDQGMERLVPFETLTELNIKGTAVTAEGLRHVVKLKTLGRIRLGDKQVTDQTLEVLAAAKRLYFLPQAYNREGDQDGLDRQEKVILIDLTDSAVTPAGLRHLADLKNLTSLRLREDQMTSAGLKPLAALKGLASLDLRYEQVTDAVLAALGGAGLLHLLPGVKGPGTAAPTKPEEVVRLDLSKTKVAGAALRHLAGLNNLTDLGLPPGLPTDDVLAGLAAARLLHALPSAWAAGGRRAAREEDVVLFSLRDTAVTDEGLKHLAGLKNLNSLGLEGTKVTDAGVAKLQAALPGCKIDR